MKNVKVCVVDSPSHHVSTVDTLRMRGRYSGLLHSAAHGVSCIRVQEAYVSQTQPESGQLVIGDSHEYDEAITPFDKTASDQLVIGYLRTFLDLGLVGVVERWHGVYVKHPRDPYCEFSPEAGVTAVAAVGGHGMTLSFGLAEQVVETLIDG